LWWRIVGMTDRVINNKVNEEDKNGELLECEEEVFRLVPDNSKNFEVNNFENLAEIEG